MTSLTPEERAYKEKTVEQLVENFAILEKRLDRERRSDVVENVQTQLEELQAHITLLQQELKTNIAGEPVADELYRRIATALTTNKFYLAKKLINKLGTIEPFYPNIDRLQSEAEAGRASRRTQAIAKGGALPEVVLSPSLVESVAAQAPESTADVVDDGESLEREKTGIARIFQFHVVASCLVIFLLACVMFGLGGITALQWLIEGS